MFFPENGLTSPPRSVYLLAFPVKFLSSESCFPQPGAVDLTQCSSAMLGNANCGVNFLASSGSQSRAEGPGGLGTAYYFVEELMDNPCLCHGRGAQSPLSGLYLHDKRV